jgi:drug/metabolite transporter (DMT)-like permease
MNKEFKADISLFIATIVWGSSFPIVSLALKDFPPYSFVMLRYLLATVMLLPLCFKRLKNINKETVIAGGIIGVTVFAGTVLQTAGLVYTTPSKSGFITGLNVVVVPILIAIIYKKFPDVRTIMGVIISLVGLGVMSLSGKMSLNFGDILTIVGAIMFSIQILVVDKYATNVDILLLTFVEFFATGIFSIIPAGIIERFNFNFNFMSIFGIAYTALFCTVIAYLIQNNMQPYTNPSHAAIIYLAEPVFSAIFSTFIGDRLTGRTLVGCILIFLGMIVINLKVIISKTMVKNEVGHTG